MKNVPTPWHEGDPHDNATLQQEIKRWSRSNTMGILLLQLGLDMNQTSEKFDLLVQQVIRWSWEVQSVQMCNSELGLTYHPVRTAWLWMEEYGSDIWPVENDKRRHLDPSTSFVYLRDRSTPSHVQADHSLEIDENISDFCFQEDKLHPHNSMFQNVLRWFASIHAGLCHEVDYTLCKDRTAAELMADFLGLEPWIPLDDLLPLYYGGLCSESDGSCESYDCACSACSGSRDLAGLEKHPVVLELSTENVDLNDVPASSVDGMEV
jgi:hypothetical protein